MDSVAAAPQSEGCTEQNRHKASKQQVSYNLQHWLAGKRSNEPYLPHSDQREHRDSVNEKLQRFDDAFWGPSNRRASSSAGRIFNTADSTAQLTQSILARLDHDLRILAQEVHAALDSNSDGGKSVDTSSNEATSTVRSTAL